MKKTALLLFLLFGTLFAHSQGKFILQDNKEKDRISFKLINNLVVIPIEINGAKLTFLLDSGVKKPIIFNLLNTTDSLSMKHTETIYLRGLGEGEPVEAIKSTGNVFKVGKAININQTLYAVFNEHLNFAPRLGIPVHGIIGYDVFKDFIVEINYSGKYIKLYNPLTYTYKTCKKCETFDLEFNNGKPYFNAEIKLNNQKVPVKLLIDSGGSDALWLFEDNEKDIKLEGKYFRDFLGRGLSGSVYGRRSKVQEIYLKSFVLKDVNVAYPDEESIAFVRHFKERNGSFSGALIKRFNVIIDYYNAKITFRKSRYFKDPFNYNKSGIELEQTGIRMVREKDPKMLRAKTGNSPTQNRIIINTHYSFSMKPAYSIVELRKGSPAERIGLKKGDILLYINNKATHYYNLQEITHIFYGETNKRMRLKVERKGIPLTFQFRLESPMK